MATRNRGTKSKGHLPRATRAQVADLQRQLATTEDMLARAQRENDLRIDMIDSLSARLDNTQRVADTHKRRRDQALSVPYQTRRVTRTLVYTGDPEWVARQLAQALEDGGHVMGSQQGSIVVKTTGDETTNVRPFTMKLKEAGSRLPDSDRIPESLPAMGQSSYAGARTSTRGHETDAFAYALRNSNATTKDPHGPGTAKAPRFYSDRELEARRNQADARVDSPGVFPR